MDTVVQSIVNSISSGAMEKSLHNRELCNKSIGLNTTTGEGNCCVTVGVHPDIPDVFIKVVTNDDPCIQYMQAILDGELSGKLFIKVHNLIKIDKHTLILMERLDTDEVGYQVAKDIEYNEDVSAHGICQKELQAFHDWFDSKLRANWRIDIDIHSSNVGKRKDGSYVLFDPVFRQNHFDKMRKRRRELAEFTCAK